MSEAALLAVVGRPPRRFRRYGEYKDSGLEWLGKIPSHWDVAKIWRIADAISGGTPAKEDLRYWGGPIPWVSPKDMKRRLIDSSEETITEEALAETGLKLLLPPVVLIVVRGMILAHTFPTAITKVPVTINQDMKALRLQQGIQPEFLAWVFEGLGKGILASTVDEAAHGTRVIRMDRWRGMVMPIPPPDEQQAITTFLDCEMARIDALVAKKERLIELLEEKGSTLVTRAVTKGLDPNVQTRDSGVEWLGEIPAHWEPRKIKRLYKRVKRQGYPEETVLSVYRDHGVIEKSSRDDNFNRTPEDLESYQLVNARDLVINKMKAWQGSLGVSALIGITSPDYIVFAPLHSYDDRYLHHLLRCRLLADVFRAISNGIRPNQWRLEPEKFEDLVVIVPPRDEQHRIVEVLDLESAKLETLMTRIRTAIAHLHELRTALISAAVTGKIDVREEVAP